MYFHDIADVLHELEMHPTDDGVEFYCPICKKVIPTGDVYGGDE